MLLADRPYGRESFFQCDFGTPEHRKTVRDHSRFAGSDSYLSEALEWVVHGAAETETSSGRTVSPS